MDLYALLDKIHNQDCVASMKALPDGCVDLVLADPPYNLDKNFGHWDERKRKEEWLPWSKLWLDQVKRILRPGGNLFVYGIHKHLCWLQCYLYEIELTYRRQIIWRY